MRKKKIGRPSRERILNRIAVEKYIHSKKGKATRKRYYLMHRKERLEYLRIWRKDLLPIEEICARKALRKFKGRCHACGIKRSSSKGWHLDHKEGRYRGILCHFCNVAIGFVHESIPRLRKLIKYLRRTNCV